MSSHEPETITTAEFHALKERLAALEARDARRRKLMLVLVAVGVVTAPFAMAASGACPNGYPFCFTPDSPALASEVNHNFSQIKEWLETKAGTVSNAGIVTRDLGVSSDAGVNGNLGVRSGLTVTGNTNLNGATTVNGGLQVNNNQTVTGTLQVNGNFYSGGNSHDDCYTSNYECGWIYCGNGYYMVGIDIAENEACGGGGDFDFSSFAVRCCRL